MKRLISVAILLLLLASISIETRKPRVGDRVVIMVNNDLAPLSDGGKIADQSKGFVCLSDVSVNVGSNSLLDSMGESPYDLCIAIDQISLLTWRP